MRQLFILIFCSWIGYSFAGRGERTLTVQEAISSLEKRGFSVAWPLRGIIGDVVLQEGFSSNLTATQFLEKLQCIPALLESQPPQKAFLLINQILVGVWGALNSALCNRGQKAEFDKKWICPQTRRPLSLLVQPFSEQAPGPQHPHGGFLFQLRRCCAFRAHAFWSFRCQESLFEINDGVPLSYVWALCTEITELCDEPLRQSFLEQLSQYAQDGLSYEDSSWRRDTYPLVLPLLFGAMIEPLVMVSTWKDEILQETEYTLDSLCVLLQKCKRAPLNALQNLQTQNRPVPLIFASQPPSVTSLDVLSAWSADVMARHGVSAPPELTTSSLSLSKPIPHQEVRLPVKLSQNGNEKGIFHHCLTSEGLLSPEEEVILSKIPRNRSHKRKKSSHVSGRQTVNKSTAPVFCPIRPTPTRSTKSSGRKGFTRLSQGIEKSAIVQTARHEERAQKLPRLDTEAPHNESVQKTVIEILDLAEEDVINLLPKVLEAEVSSPSPVRSPSFQKFSVGQLRAALNRLAQNPPRSPQQVPQRTVRMPVSQENERRGKSEILPSFKDFLKYVEEREI